MIDDIYIYALTNKSIEYKRNSGFYFLNLRELVNKDEESHNSFKLKQALVGLNTYLSYYKNDERMAYMTDYESVKIIPVLHRNTLSFFGIQKKSNYLCFAKISDKFIALDFDNVLTTYSCATGKVLKKHKLKQEVIIDGMKIW